MCMYVWHSRYDACDEGVMGVCIVHVYVGALGCIHVGAGVREGVVRGAWGTQNVNGDHELTFPKFVCPEKALELLTRTCAL